MLLKDASPLTTFAEISSGIENVYEVLSTDPTHTKPACKVTTEVFEVTGTLKDTSAFAAVLERGT